MNKLKKKSTGLPTITVTPADPAGASGFAAYPPVVKKVEILGYVEDTSGIFHSRDIGVSFQLFGRTYLIFGDTFCKNSRDEFTGLQSNTAAIVEDANQPTKSKYLETDPDGKIKAFIPMSEAEKQLVSSGKAKRVALWPFSGSVELDDGTGRVWYSKLVNRGAGDVYAGVGVAKLVPKLRGQISVERSDDVVFGPEEPRVGTFSSIVDAGYVYLYGDNGHDDILLARVPSRSDLSACMLDKHSYTFWNGKQYVANPAEAVPVFHQMSQGSIIRTQLFGPNKPFVFVGVDHFADSKVLVGASSRLEGPWTLHAVHEAQGITVHKDYRYCMYPHLWASNEEKGELVVSWCEPSPGGMIMAKMTLAYVTDTNMVI